MTSNYSELNVSLLPSSDTKLPTLHVLVHKIGSNATFEYSLVIDFLIDFFFFFLIFVWYQIPCVSHIGSTWLSSPSLCVRVLKHYCFLRTLLNFLTSRGVVKLAVGNLENLTRFFRIGFFLPLYRTWSVQHPSLKVLQPMHLDSTEKAICSWQETLVLKKMEAMLKSGFTVLIFEISFWSV